MGTDASTANPPSGSCIVKPRSIIDRIDPTELFPKCRPLEIELGCGDGSFLLEYARLHPNLNLIGIERLLGRLRKTDRKVLRENLQNVRLLRIEARYFVEYLLPRASAQAIHVYFPDPWPKRRHWKNRLIDAGFVDCVARALVPGGAFYFRTDDFAYWQVAGEILAGCSDLSPALVPGDVAAIRTDFEREFLKRGTVTRSLAYHRR
jgi:tRNA (guanine-N7-)-methyltransferase